MLCLQSVTFILFHKLKRPIIYIYIFYNTIFKVHHLQHHLLNLMSVETHELSEPTNQQISLCKEINHSLIPERLSEHELQWKALSKWYLTSVGLLSIRSWLFEEIFSGQDRLCDYIYAYFNIFM